MDAGPTQGTSANDQIGYSRSLPATPFVQTLDESLSQSKRRKTEPADDNDQPSQVPQEAPGSNQPQWSSNFPVSGFVAINGKVNDQRTTGLNGDTAHPEERASTGQTGVSSHNKPTSPPTRPRSNLHALIEPQPEEVSQGVEAEVPEPTNDEKPDTKEATLDASTNQGNRRTRKSMPAKLREAEDAENNAKQPQTVTPRPGRKSKLAAQIHAKVPKSASRVNVRTTPRTIAPFKSGKDSASQGAEVDSPAPPSTTRGRRRGRKPAIQVQEDDANSSNVTPVRSYRKRRSTAKANKAQDQEMADSAAQSPDSNDTEIYGEDMDGPSVKNSASGRISRRNRKPTMRAVESLESEKQYRRKKAAEQMAAEEGRTPHHPDMEVVAQRLFDLAAEAVSPDYVVTAEDKAQLKQLRKDYWARKKRAVEAEAAAESGGESLAIRTKPTFSTNTKTSDPWVDPNGWTHTGHANEHGEEYLFIPTDFELYRPNNTYNDKQLPQPPIRLKSREQLERDRVFGFPPRIGDRNVPQNCRPFAFEDVEEEKAKAKAREEARSLGISVNGSLSVADIRAMIAQHGHAGSLPQEIPGGGASGVTRRRRRRTQPVADDGSEHQPKPRRRRQPATAPSTPAQAPPESPDKKTMKIKLKFGRGNMTPSSSGCIDVTSPKSRKRGYSATEDGSVGAPALLEDKSTKKRRLSTSEVDNMVQAAATSQPDEQGGSGSGSGSPSSADTVLQPELDSTEPAGAESRLDV